jgi:ssDNA-binding replication factor A large subunit
MDERIGKIKQLEWRDGGRRFGLRVVSVRCAMMHTSKKGRQFDKR